MKKKHNFLIFFPLVIFAACIIGIIIIFISQTKVINNSKLIQPNQFQEYLESGQVTKVTFKTRFIDFWLKDDETMYQTFNPDTNEFYLPIMNSDIEINGLKTSNIMLLLDNLVPLLWMVIILMVIYLIIFTGVTQKETIKKFFERISSKGKQSSNIKLD